MWKLFNKIIAFTVIFSMVFEQSGFAQVAPQMPLPAYINGYVAADRFRPVQLRSLNFDSTKQNFDLFLDKGDDVKISPKQINRDAKLLMKYFHIGLALPNDSFWVNLRPDAARQIIDPYLEQTDLGQVMLAADLQLKKDLARFTSPNTQEGRQYWNKLYARAEKLFGDQEISIPTVTRPWIVPGEILLSETNSTCHILKASLKVCLEQDYLKDGPSINFEDARLKELNEFSSQMIRELVIPKLTREVNSSKKYAGLRQVYYSLVLAQWFKQKYQGQKGEYSQKINSRDLSGLTSAKPWKKEKYFNAYKKSFEKGEYNLSESTVSASGMTVRQYFSGGGQLSKILSDAIFLTAPTVVPSSAADSSVAGLSIRTDNTALKDGLVEVNADGGIVDRTVPLNTEDEKDDGYVDLGNPAGHRRIFSDIVKNYFSEKDQPIRTDRIILNTQGEINALAWAIHQTNDRQIQEQLSNLNLRPRISEEDWMQINLRYVVVAEEFRRIKTEKFQRQNTSGRDGGSEHSGMDLVDSGPLSTLTAKLKDDSSSVRELAARDLGNRNAINALPELKEALKIETIRNVRNTIAYAVAKIDKSALQDISKDMSQSAEVRDSAQRALSDLKRKGSSGSNRNRRDGGNALSIMQELKVWTGAMRIAWNISPVEKVAQEGWTKDELRSLLDVLSNKGVISKWEAFIAAFFPLAASVFVPLVVLVPLGATIAAFGLALGLAVEMVWFFHLLSMGSDRISRVAAAEEWLVANRLTDTLESETGIKSLDGGSSYSNSVNKALFSDLIKVLREARKDEARIDKADKDGLRAAKRKMILRMIELVRSRLGQDKNKSLAEFNSYVTRRVNGSLNRAQLLMLGAILSLITLEIHLPLVIPASILGITAALFGLTVSRHIDALIIEDVFRAAKDVNELSRLEKSVQEPGEHALPGSLKPEVLDALIVQPIIKINLAGNAVMARLDASVNKALTKLLNKYIQAKHAGAAKDTRIQTWTGSQKKDGGNTQKKLSAIKAVYKEVGQIVGSYNDEIWSHDWQIVVDPSRRIEFDSRLIKSRNDMISGIQHVLWRFKPEDRHEVSYYGRKVEHKWRLGAFVIASIGAAVVVNGLAAGFTIPAAAVLSIIFGSVSAVALLNARYRSSINGYIEEALREMYPSEPVALKAFQAEGAQDIIENADIFKEPVNSIIEYIKKADNAPSETVIRKEFRFRGLNTSGFALLDRLALLSVKSALEEAISSERNTLNATAAAWVFVMGTIPVFQFYLFAIALASGYVFVYSNHMVNRSQDALNKLWPAITKAVSMDLSPQEQKIVQSINFILGGARKTRAELVEDDRIIQEEMMKYKDIPDDDGKRFKSYQKMLVQHEKMRGEFKIHDVAGLVEVASSLSLGQDPEITLKLIIAHLALTAMSEKNDIREIIAEALPKIRELSKDRDDNGVVRAKDGGMIESEITRIFDEVEERLSRFNAEDPNLLGVYNAEVKENLINKLVALGETWGAKEVIIDLRKRSRSRPPDRQLDCIREAIVRLENLAKDGGSNTPEIDDVRWVNNIIWGGVTLNLQSPEYLELWDHLVRAWSDASTSAARTDILAIINILEQSQRLIEDLERTVTGTNFQEPLKEAKTAHSLLRRVSVDEIVSLKEMHSVASVIAALKTITDHPFLESTNNFVLKRALEELAEEETRLHNAEVLSLYAGKLKITATGSEFMFNTGEVIKALQEISGLESLYMDTPYEPTVLGDLKNIVLKGPEILAKASGSKEDLGKIILLAAQILAKNAVEFTGSIMRSLLPLLNMTDDGRSGEGSIGLMTARLMISQNEEVQELIREIISAGKLAAKDLAFAKKVLETVQNGNDGGSTAMQKIVAKIKVAIRTNDEEGLRRLHADLIQLQHDQIMAAVAIAGSSIMFNDELVAIDDMKRVKEKGLTWLFNGFMEKVAIGQAIQSMEAGDSVGHLYYVGNENDPLIVLYPTIRGLKTRYWKSAAKQDGGSAEQNLKEAIELYQANQGPGEEAIQNRIKAIRGFAKLAKGQAETAMEFLINNNYEQSTDHEMQEIARAVFALSQHDSFEYLWLEFLLWYKDKTTAGERLLQSKAFLMELWDLLRKPENDKYKFYRPVMWEVTLLKGLYILDHHQDFTTDESVRQIQELWSKYVNRGNLSIGNAYADFIRRVGEGAIDSLEKITGDIRQDREKIIVTNLLKFLQKQADGPMYFASEKYMDRLMGILLNILKQIKTPKEKLLQDELFQETVLTVKVYSSLDIRTVFSQRDFIASLTALTEEGNITAYIAIYAARMISREKFDGGSAEQKLKEAIELYKANQGPGEEAMQNRIKAIKGLAALDSYEANRKALQFLINNNYAGSTDEEMREIARKLVGFKNSYLDLYSDLLLPQKKKNIARDRLVQSEAFLAELVELLQGRWAVEYYIKSIQAQSETYYNALWEARLLEAFLILSNYRDHASDECIAEIRRLGHDTGNSHFLTSYKQSTIEDYELRVGNGLIDALEKVGKDKNAQDIAIKLLQALRSQKIAVPDQRLWEVLVDLLKPMKGEALESDLFKEAVNTIIQYSLWAEQGSPFRSGNIAKNVRAMLEKEEIEGLTALNRVMAVNKGKQLDGGDVNDAIEEMQKIAFIRLLNTIADGNRAKQFDLSGLVRSLEAAMQEENRQASVASFIADWCLDVVGQSVTPKFMAHVRTVANKMNADAAKIVNVSEIKGNLKLQQAVVAGILKQLAKNLDASVYGPGTGKQSADVGWQDVTDNSDDQAPDRTGGVDFRALPVPIGAVPSVAAGAGAAMPQISLKELDNQWKEILRTAQKGELPYQKMKQLVSCCKAKEEALGLKQEVTAYVVNLLKCEEERAISTPEQLKEIVALVAA